MLRILKILVPGWLTPEVSMDTVNPLYLGKPLNEYFLQTVKSIMLHFISVYTVCKDKKCLQTKEYNMFFNYNLTPLDMYYVPKFIVSNQKEESISIQRVKQIV